MRLVFGVVIFLLFLEERGVESFLPLRNHRSCNNAFFTALASELINRQSSITGVVSGSSLRMSTLAAPPQIHREATSVPNIAMPIVTLPNEQKMKGKHASSARSSFVKRLSKQNKKYMKDGIRLREKYVKYRLMTTAEEMTAGKFAAVGKLLIGKKAALVSRLGRDVSIDEWATECKMSVESLELYLSIAKRARNRLVQHNMNLVDFHVRSIIDSTSVGKEMPYFQLVAEGAVGLSEAVESYDGRGRFSLYANPFIRSRIYKAITALRPGSILSHSTVMTYHRALKVRARLLEATGREPTIAEIAAELKLSEANVKASMRDCVTKRNSISAQSVLSVNDDNEPTTYLDLFLSARQNARSDDAATWYSEFLDALSCLDAGERRTIEVRYGLLDGNPRSVEDTAELMAVSEESVRKMVNSSFEKLRSCCKSPRLQEGVPQSAATTLNGKKGVAMY